MTPTYQDREERYQNAPADVQKLYAGEESGATLRNIFKTLNLDDALYKTFATVCGDIILGFEPLGNAALSFQQKLNIPPETAAQLVGKLKTDFFRTENYTYTPAASATREKEAGGQAGAEGAILKETDTQKTAGYVGGASSPRPMAARPETPIPMALPKTSDSKQEISDDPIVRRFVKPPSYSLPHTGEKRADNPPDTNPQKPSE